MTNILCSVHYNLLFTLLFLFFSIRGKRRLRDMITKPAKSCSCKDKRRLKTKKYKDIVQSDYQHNALAKSQLDKQPVSSNMRFLSSSTVCLRQPWPSLHGDIQKFLNFLRLPPVATDSRSHQLLLGSNVFIFRSIKISNSLSYYYY